MTVIEDCGHVIQEDQPQAVAKALLHLINALRVPLRYDEEIVVTSVSGKKILINNR